LKSIYKVNLGRVPEFARDAILKQIAREEGIEISEIVVEGVE
jgi:hypothetical protein